MKKIVSPLLQVAFCGIFVALSGCPDKPTKPDQTTALPGATSDDKQQLAASPDAAATPNATPASNAQAMPNSGSNPQPGSNSIASMETSSKADSLINADDEETRNRSFANMQPLESQAPADAIEYLKEIDGAIQDLMVASANNLLEEETFRSAGVRLGQFKLDAGQQLSENESATPEQRKTGLMAKLVALSHLTGFQDVKAAQKLEAFAKELSNSDDTYLAHQSTVVLAGFQIQALQNGLSDEPSALLSSVEGLFTRPQDRGFPELMVLLQSDQVLTQMGFSDQAKQVRELLVSEFSQAEEAQLRAEAWNVATAGSPALDNYFSAFSSLGTSKFDQTAAFAAARGLFDAYPTLGTLEQLAGIIEKIEYAGYVQLSQQLSDFVSGKLLDQNDTTLASTIKNTLTSHNKRMNLIGKPLPTEGLIGFDGKQLDWSAYEGKLVLVDFWASWCTPCLREIPNIRSTYDAFHEKGFEVVGISMDDNLDEARRLLEAQRFPWSNYHPEDQQRLGFDAELVERLGVSNIPFMVLIGEDGLVADIHVRGDQLPNRVRELLQLENSLIPQ